MLDPNKVADVAGKVIDLASDFGKFLDKVLGPAATESGGLLGEQIRFWRAMRLLNLNRKFDAELEKRGLTYEDLKPLPLGQSVPLIEAASMEDADEIQELWAGLLASSMDPKSGFAFKRPYIGILKEIGPAETTLLEVLWKIYPHQIRFELTKKSAIEEELNAFAAKQWRRLPKIDQESAASNLRRLGCILPIVTAPQLSGLFSQTLIADGRTARGSTLTTIDPRKLDILINWILEVISINVGGTPMPVRDSTPLVHQYGHALSDVKVPEFSFVLSPLGIDLLSACYGKKMGEPVDAPQ